jgi:FAD:protein FMN transferase
MGTVVTVDLRDEGIIPGAVDDVFGWLHDVDATFSTFKPDSQISRLSRGEINEGECDREVREVLGLCAEVERRSGGCFDVRCQDGVDPSALVKGWSIERAACMLTAAGARNFLINAGGDIVARGQPAPDRSWRLGIRHPEIADRFAAVLDVGNVALATSGLYERGEHIVDPRSGRAATGLRSMTVIGPSLTYADAYATAAFVMGEPGTAWVATIAGYGAIAITADRRTVWTADLDSMLVDAQAGPI